MNIIYELLEHKNISKYRLSKLSGVPYTTLSDICSGKTDLMHCSVDTIYHLAKGLDVTMECLVEPYLEPRPDFELFKSNVCHHLKEVGDVGFLIETIDKNKIDYYYQKQWYPECFYLLAMVDYISRLNDVPLCEEFSSLRKQKLKDTLYPASVLCLSLATNDESVKEKAKETAIPEFLRFNIVESEVRNVV